MSDGHRTNVGRTSDGHRMNIGQTSDGHRMNNGPTPDKQWANTGPKLDKGRVDKIIRRVARLPTDQNLFQFVQTQLLR
ncbi:hypothetical protein L5515_006647 [Caenorhabditis briggsae]|uniref:Uncharacterized protein n=1 Tax=Caenorhabditis briggsae TaxID=6238 RepID=A0AAE9JJ17_CAEBR|nr:hypothetical protein L5515_006647 [Caenorhabditis briggsae]